jgi:hypothetical protein
MSASALVYWQDPIQTGAIFGCVLVALTSLTYCSLLSVVAYSALALLTAVVGIKLYSFVMIKTGKAQPGSDPLAEVAKMNLTVSEAAVSSHASCVATNINWALGRARGLLLVDSPVDTMKFGLCLYVLTYFGAWFNALTLITLAWVGLFTLPKVYLNNQAQVDEVMGKVMGQVDEIKAKVVDMLPASLKPAVVKKEE